MKSTMEKKIKLVSKPGDAHFRGFRDIFGFKKVQKTITLYEKLPAECLLNGSLDAEDQCGGERARGEGWKMRMGRCEDGVPA